MTAHSEPFRRLQIQYTWRHSLGQSAITETFFSLFPDACQDLPVAMYHTRYHDACIGLLNIFILYWVTEVANGKHKYENTQERYFSLETNFK